MIHHLNGNPHDNHSDNLVLLPKWAHWVMHTWDRAGWFREYGGEIFKTVKEFIYLDQMIGVKNSAKKEN